MAAQTSRSRKRERLESLENALVQLSQEQAKLKIMHQALRKMAYLAQPTERNLNRLAQSAAARDEEARQHAAALLALSSAPGNSETPLVTVEKGNGSSGRGRGGRGSGNSSSSSASAAKKARSAKGSSRMYISADQIEF